MHPLASHSQGNSRGVARQEVTIHDYCRDTTLGSSRRHGGPRTEPIWLNVTVTKSGRTYFCDFGHQKWSKNRSKFNFFLPWRGEMNLVTVAGCPRTSELSVTHVTVERPEPRVVSVQ